MTDLTGRDLEDLGQQVFTRMGLISMHRLKQVKWRELDPSGPYSQNDHLELDYLIPFRNTCLVGEITGSRNGAEIEKKYRRFRRKYDAIRGIKLTEQTWRLLGVPNNRLHEFRGCTEFKGFFIAASLERFDVDLPGVPEIACFFRSDWVRLAEYSEAIGQFARYPFLDVFDIQDSPARHDLKLRETSHALMRTSNKRIAGGAAILADIYSFEASPYELLPMTKNLSEN